MSVFYDPMIAKLVTWAPTRNAATDLQVEALDAFRIEGLGHNIDFLSALMQHPRFRSGKLTTARSAALDPRSRSRQFSRDPKRRRNPISVSYLNDSKQAPPAKKRAALQE